jgi:hypothetical protein
VVLELLIAPDRGERREVVVVELVEELLLQEQYTSSRAGKERGHGTAGDTRAHHDHVGIVGHAVTSHEDVPRQQP